MDIDEFKGKIELVGVYSEPEGAYQLPNDALLQFIGILMEPVVNYFEDGVGWKTPDGEIIPYEPVTICKGAGYDPAL
jgi:hypothetical protein